MFTDANSPSGILMGNFTALMTYARIEVARLVPV